MYKILFKAFREYLTRVSSISISSQDSIKKNRIIYIRPLKKLEECEKTKEFSELVNKSIEEQSFMLHGFLKGRIIWGHSIKNFFRRSGYYYSVIENKPTNVDDIFKTYLQAFQRLNVQRTYLVPMGLVNFSEKSMDFGSFQIQRFTKKELISKCQNEINENFYPYAHISLKQMNLLQNCWFISITESIPISKEDYFPWDEISRVKPEYTSHPRPVELALKKLVLFDWQWDQMRELPCLDGQKKETCIDKERFWQGFEVPFIIVIDDDPLKSPRRIDISRLRTVPGIHPHSGEEIGEIPETAIHFDGQETDAFKRFILEIESIFRDITPLENDWKFIEVALGFFVKAFFTEGLEQLLWHITTVEALLGENAENLRQRLANRIALVCGKTKREKKELRKEFLSLYDFRCDLVHGNVFQKQVYVGHLCSARSLSLKTLRWYLHCLKNIKEHLKDKGEFTIPTRKDILLAIDLDYSERSRLSCLNKELPSEFPFISNWIK